MFYLVSAAVATVILSLHSNHFNLATFRSKIKNWDIKREAGISNECTKYFINILLYINRTKKLKIVVVNN